MKHLVMGTAGHVDHGKTALIKALTNIDCDTHKEEKKRGITINLGFSHLDLPSGNSIGIIDVPGHKDFINTMVSGASGIDFVMLVIAADSGIMPQTIEHLNIIKSLDIKYGLVALNKIDLVDNEIAELAKMEISELLKENQLENFQIVGVSAKTGQGLNDIVNAIENIIPKIPEKEKHGAFRMYIDRLFTVKGVGVIVTGSVLSGEISIDDELIIQPDLNTKVRIKTIQRHGKNVEKVVAGDRAALNISGIKKEDFKRGMLLSNQQLETTQMIDVALNMFENSPKLKLWSTVTFHAGTFECQTKIHLLDKDIAEPGTTVIAQIHLSKPAILFNKDKFIIRNSSGDKTIAGGIVIDNFPLHHRKRPAELIEKLQILYDTIKNEKQISGLIELELKKQNSVISLVELSKSINAKEDDILSALKQSSSIKFHQLKDGSIVVVLKEKEDFYVKQIIDSLTDYHSKYFLLNEGVSLNYFYGKFKSSNSKIFKQYIDILIKKLIDKKLIKKVKGTFSLYTHNAKHTAKSEKDIEWLKKVFLDYKLQKPVLHDIEKSAYEQNISKDELKMYYKYLENTNFLIKYNQDYIAKEIVDNVFNILSEKLKNTPEGINLSEFRQLTSCSKKAIPLFIGIFESKKLISTRQKDTHTYISLI